MSEIKPCPFCGSTEIEVASGSTFRWKYAFCTGCGAQTDEVRIDTMSEDREAAEAKAREDAFKEWNRRVPQLDPERDTLVGLLRRARYFVEADVAMMDAITRHAPLPFEDQAKHDATEYPSERLLREIDAALKSAKEK